MRREVAHPSGENVAPVLPTSESDSSSKLEIPLELRVRNPSCWLQVLFNSGLLGRSVAQIPQKWLLQTDVCSLSEMYRLQELNSPPPRPAPLS